MIVAIVGLTGVGKSEASVFFGRKGFAVVRVGSITYEMLEEEDLTVNEENELYMRQKIRKIHGPEAYAKLNSIKIDKLDNENRDVVIDGIRTKEELDFLKNRYSNLIVLFLEADRDIRLDRIVNRKDGERTYSPRQAKDRDLSEVQIFRTHELKEYSDYQIDNSGSMVEFIMKLDNVFDLLCNYNCN